MNLSFLFLSFNNIVQDKIQNALQIIQECFEEEGLNISPFNMAIIAFARRRKLDSLGLLENNLNVIFNSKLT